MNLQGSWMVCVGDSILMLNDCYPETSGDMVYFKDGDNVNAVFNMMNIQGFYAVNRDHKALYVQHSEQ